MPKFASPGGWVSSNGIQVTYKANDSLMLGLDAHSDYSIDELTAPEASVVYSGDVWGTGVWGTFVWGSSAEKDSFTEWQAAYANGYSVAPSVQVTSNSTAKLVFEIISTRVIMDPGGS